MRVNPDWFLPLEKALNSLDALEAETFSAAIRDAWIQRFEYSLELCWKTCRRVLAEQGLEAVTPKDVFRKAGAAGLLSDVDLWLDFVDKRNLTSHTYNEEVAAEVYQVIPRFRLEARALYAKLREDPD